MLDACPIDAEPSNRGLPRVDAGIDQARKQRTPLGIDGFGAFRDLESGPNGKDLITFDQKISRRKNSDFGSMDRIVAELKRTLVIE